MIGVVGYGTNLVGQGATADVRRYANWEYGAADAQWFLARVGRARPATRTWTVRLRYWLNSFRGFASFDVRGRDERA